MKAAVILTASAGGQDSMGQQDTTQQVEEAFRREDVAATVTVVQGSQLSHAVQLVAASAVDVIVIGGGDGSVSTAAAVLADDMKPLGVLPLGTLNHFAKDLGLPLELEQAVRSIAHGQVRQIDVGEVNGHVFINNSSIGLYPRAVRHRDEHQQRHGWSKWPAMLFAALTVARQFQLLRISLTADGRVLRLTTPFVFVGNNEYEMSLFSMGRRICLDGGALGLYVAKTSGRWAMARLVLYALVGRLDQAKEFESRCLPEFQIDAKRPSLQVACDGEVTSMRPPLHYRIRPRALRVMARPPSV